MHTQLAQRILNFLGLMCGTMVKIEALEQVMS